MSQTIPFDFIPNIYLELNPDVAEFLPGVYSVKHYIKYGIDEGRIYKYSQIPCGYFIEDYREWLNVKNSCNSNSFQQYISYQETNSNTKLTNLILRAKQFNSKVVFLISHEKSNTGAPIALINLHNYYNKHNVSNFLLYLPDIENSDYISYILSQSIKIECTPIVICNTLVCYNIVDALSKTSIPTYWYIHEWIDEFSNFNNNYNYVDFNIFGSSVTPIFICNKSYENYKKYVPILNQKYPLIIYNGISEEIIENKKNSILEKDFIKSENDIIVAIIGMIDVRKNQVTFISDVFYRCADKYPNVKLLLVGKDTLNIAEIINSSYSDKICIIGEVSNAIPYINISDIIVSYSLNEVFPLNILESFYCSKPVVSTNVGAVSEIIEDSINGFMFEKNDSDKCFELLCNLIENQGLRNSIGSSGKKKFLETYIDDITFNKFLEL